MIIEFHFAGENRKKLAWVVAMIIGTTAEYQYMPTCAYKIGECYTVTKSGNLEISDQADREETERLLAELENQGYAVPDTSELESKGLTVQMPADFFTEHTLGNLRQICENKAALFQTAFQTDSLDIIPSDEKVEFPWFMVEQDGDADAPLDIPISRDPYFSPILILAEPYNPILNPKLPPDITSRNLSLSQSFVSMLNFPVAIVPPRPFTIPPPLTK